MIKLAIPGTGSMAHSHAGNYLSIKDVKITAVCDTKFDVQRNLLKNTTSQNFR